MCTPERGTCPNGHDKALCSHLYVTLKPCSGRKWRLIKEELPTPPQHGRCPNAHQALRKLRPLIKAFWEISVHLPDCQTEKGLQCHSQQKYRDYKVISENPINTQKTQTTSTINSNKHIPCGGAMISRFATLCLFKCLVFNNKKYMRHARTQENMAHTQENKQ